MDLFFGIDGGGTHSRIKIIDTQKNEVYYGTGGCTNINAAGCEAVAENVRSLFNAVFAAGFTASSFSGGCLGCSGLDAQGERDFFSQLFSAGLGITCPVKYCNDSITALVGGVGRSEGYILISGTGSIATALRRDGVSVRAGGWGQTLGDEGSGYWTGLQGIQRAIRSLECRDIPSRLPKIMFDFYGVTGIRDLFPFVYHTFDKAKIASFALPVFNAAREGDELASLIVEEAACELSLLCKSVHDRMDGMQNHELVFSGGMLEHEQDFAAAIIRKIGENAPEIRVIERRHDPAFGACLLAMEMERV